MALNPAFNGDSFIQAQIAHLIKKHGIKVAVETGTYHGETTLFLASLVPQVITTEINPETFKIALQNFKKIQGVISYLGYSPNLLQDILPSIREPVLFYLDAHNPGCPLHDELQIIAKYCPDRAVLAIHDFVVPGKDFGYDSYEGHNLDFDYIKEYLPAIYPSGFNYYYNLEAQGAYRGIIYIEPK